MKTLLAPAMFARRHMIAHPEASVDDILAAMKNAKVELSRMTVQSLRNEFRTIYRLLAEAGLLKDTPKVKQTYPTTISGAVAVANALEEHLLPYEGNLRGVNWVGTALVAIEAGRKEDSRVRQLQLA